MMDEKDFLKDFQTRGCPACNHIGKTVADFLAGWQYSLACDERVQQEFVLELGFCPFHTWQLASLSSPQGISKGYQKLLKHISAELKKFDKTAIDLPESFCPKQPAGSISSLKI